MNILFVNYGDFTTNSLNHIGGFANALCTAGHACIVAVPAGKETLAHIPNPLFIPATFEEMLARPGLFPDTKPATLIHAWTPRERVRKFVIAYQREVTTPARLVVHLEDNEHFLLETYTGRSFADLRAASPSETDFWLVDALSHPLRHEAFLRTADGVTHIVDRLREFVPPGVPSHLLAPGVDFSLYQPQPADAKWRAELGLRDEEKIIAFTGSNTFANEPEMRELYLAITVLNQRGIPTRLLRTGFNRPQFLEALAPSVKAHVLDLGFVPKATLPRVLALADVLVQPGRAGPFNDFRLPSKLPEFLASGKPVVLPGTNIAALMADGREAVFLQTGSPAEIADVCQRLFSQPDLCASLGQSGVAFARRHFDLETNIRSLAQFYRAILERPEEVDWATARDATVAEGYLFARRLSARLSLPGASTADFAHEIGLLADLLRHLEETVASATEHPIGTRLLTAQASRQHIRQLETLLAKEKGNVAHLEEMRVLTKNHADNMERIAAQHREKREQADVLLQAARQQVVAYENALLKADAEIGALMNARDLAHEELRLARAGAAAEHAQDQAVIRSREEKIAKIQSSLSWRITMPLRALRRAFFDRPALPPPSPLLRGHIDHPKTWNDVPPTLSVRGWSLHNEHRPLQAMRARLGGQGIPVEFGLERPDVQDRNGDDPGSGRCGWSVEVPVPRRGTHAFQLEAQDDTGAWHVVLARELKRTTDRALSPTDSYATWVAAYDTLTPDSADRIRQKLAALKRQPLISVLMPTYNPPEKWLVRAIESVRRQLYEKWELCIADDASTVPHVRRLLERYQKKDPRIKVVYRETNGHISAASNSALALAHGEFIALLDHDDEIRPHALACVALELDAHPDADLVYSDEDKRDESGRRYDPCFKPDWNPDLFLVQNYVCHLGVYRTQLVREIGGFRIGYEGSQDWDLALRVVERSAPDRIRHIPKVLYHWHSVPGSTATAIGAKTYAVAAAEKAISEHFARTGVTATISPTKGSYWRVHYPLPEPAPRVTLIIPTRNRLNFLRPCIESLLEKTTYPNFEILIIDNDSDDPETLAYLDALAAGVSSSGTDGRGQTAEARGQRAEGGGRTIAETAEAPESHELQTPNSELRTPESAPRVRVVRFPGEFNFSAINNFGVRQTDAPVVGLLNNDLTVIHGDWLDEMVSHALRPGIGCVGAKLYYPDGRIQHAGVILGIGGIAAHPWQAHAGLTPGQNFRNLLQHSLSAVTAACLVIRREVFQEAGGFDEKLKVAFNDVDFSLRVRAAGYRNFWTPFAELYHHESASRGAEDTLEKRDRFRAEIEAVQAKWGDALVNDPAYNPNLSLTTNDFALAVPPRPWPPLD